MKYCLNLWDDSALRLDRCHTPYTGLLNSKQSRVSTSIIHLDIVSPSEFYRYYHGECSEEVNKFISSSPFVNRPTRADLKMHRHTISVVTSRTFKISDSHICCTIKMCKIFPTWEFPLFFNSGSSKKNVKKHLMSQYSKVNK